MNSIEIYYLYRFIIIMRLTLSIFHDKSANTLCNLLYILSNVGFTVKFTEYPRKTEKLISSKF